MAEHDSFDLQDFLPYLLNQAAEATSRDFQPQYRSDFGMTRVQWRVMANLGKFGAMTATEICRISHMEKTKVSRAVAGLETAGLLQRAPGPADRRTETLSLTEQGQAAFAVLGQRARSYDTALRAELGQDLADRLDTLLRRLIDRAPEGN